MNVTTPWYTYPVLVERDGLEMLATHLAPLGGYSGAMILSNEPIFDLFGALVEEQLSELGIKSSRFCLPSGEAAKSLNQASLCWEAMQRAALDRDSLVVALGGGTVGDLAGFVAGCYMSGIDYIHLPTTLLAMVDSSIGGKTGINLAGVKNLVGAFHSPRFVLADTVCLDQLPEEEYRNGLAEMVKHGVIADLELFERMAPEVNEGLIARAADIKVQIVNEDHHDRDRRALLNFGHTIGHAIEGLSNYTIAHGQAVAIGMVLEAKVAERLGMALNIAQEIATKLESLGLPTELPDLNRDALISLMRSDKKARWGQINIVLPRQIGEAELVRDIDTEILLEILS